MGAPGGWSYVEKSTGQKFLAYSFEELLDKVSQHRKSMGIPMPDGWREVVEDEMCDYNQADWDDPLNPKPYLTELQKMGRALWLELHSYRQDKEWSERDAKRFLGGWESRIPNFEHCDCRESYGRFRAELPPDFSSYDAFYSWGVSMHNKVNAKLGKPIF